MADIRCIVSEAAQSSRQQPAILTGDREIIYSEYDGSVAGSLSRLRKAGCGPGDRVAVRLSNHWQTAVLLMALFRARAIACLLDPGMALKNVENFLARIHSRRLITEKGLFSSSELVVLTPEEMVASFPEEPETDEDTRLSLDQPATITCSASKAILHSYGNHYYGARGFNHHIRSSSGCRWLLSEPLYRITGLQILFQCAVSGATLVIPEAPESMASAIHRYGVTHLLVSAPLFEELMDDGLCAKKHPGIQAIVVNGPVSEELLSRSYELKLPVYRSYGVPETASSMAVTPIGSPPSKRSTSGRITKYCRVRISADGKIGVQGQTLLMGYVEGTDVQSAIDREGWFLTEDIGALDAEEYLTVQGRA